MIVFFFGASKDKVALPSPVPALNSGLYTIVQIYSFTGHQLVRHSDVGKTAPGCSLLESLTLQTVAYH
jgi:hypothetical protein